MTSEQTAQAQLEQQANDTLARVREMCQKAYEQGLQRGYQQGFQDGVIAMGPPVQQKPANDA